ncbi:PREDICTED: probable disease resistance protein At1g61300, partial [Populus euphratica]|uniref:Probable disease resistance protein At1g61300 n=1 Tax=Populus euphratica TaxID=75702 RepID=A0AAJ6SV74_POPEU
MLRQNDPVSHHVDRSFWEYVEKMDDGRMSCKFCGHCFAKGTSISRIKLHLAGVTGRGVKICGQVPQDVQDAALAAIDGPPEKKLKTVAGSSNNDVTNEISASAQQQNNEMMMAHQLEDLWLEDWMASITVEDMEHLERGSFHERPSFNQADEVDVESNTGRFMQPGARASSSGVLNYNTSETRGDPLSCAISASAQEHNNKVTHVEMAQGQPFFTREIARDLFRGRSELVHNAPETRPLTEQASPETELPWCRYSPEELPHDAFETIPRTEQAPLLERGSSHDRQSINQVYEPREDSSQPADLLCLGHARYDDQLCSPAVNNDAIMNDVQNMDRMRKEPVEKEEEDMENNSGRSVQPGAGANSSVGLKHNTSETRGAPLPIGSTKLVGQAFEENKKVIWSWLMDDEVSTIGIYGMGGAGKTTMLKHVYNELQQIADIFPHVYWVTVSQDFSIQKLQKKIAKRIKLSLSNEEEELLIAAELSLELMKKSKWILILDDLWNSFELQEVGIPVPLKGCKLIMTTRSKEVCGRMDCRNNIIVNPLSDVDAWTLFREILGHDRHLSTEVEQFAKSITNECDGLPLGIKTMAGTMKVVDGIHGWSNALERLRQSRVGPNGMERVFSSLRFSYTHLSNEAMQKCFLYCAFFPEDSAINRLELILYLIDMGVIQGLTSRKAEFDEGHSMLDKLEKVCLLERKRLGGAVMMHDLIRDMAIQILEENSRAIVKAGAQLKELPDTEEWTDKLTTVSLMHNQIEEICSSHSVRCPNLSTLLLCSNHRLRFIAGSFFEQMHGLKVLDLSETAIECLPDSVSDLVGLTSLLLKHCRRLSRVPTLKKLRALKRLDLARAPLEEIPHGMECLSSLRYLRMNGCGENKFPCGILTKLPHLQVLILGEQLLQARGKYMGERYFLVKVEGKEVGCLRKLESLECHFEDHSNYVEYLKSRDETQSLSTYKIVVGKFREGELGELKYSGPGSKMVVLGNLNINRDGDFQVISPNDIQQLICRCIDARSLGDVLSLKYATELEYIKILNC